MTSKICVVVADVARGEQLRLREDNGREFTWPKASPEPFQAGDKVVAYAAGAGGQYWWATVDRFEQPGHARHSRETPQAAPLPAIAVHVVTTPSRATKNCYVVRTTDGTEHQIRQDEAADCYFEPGDAAILDVKRAYGERLCPLGEGKRHPRLPWSIRTYRGKTSIWSGYFWMSLNEALVEFANCKVEDIGVELRRIRTGGGAFGSAAAYTCHAILWRVGNAFVLDLREEDGDVSVHTTEEVALAALDEWLDANGGIVRGD